MDKNDTTCKQLCYYCSGNCHYWCVVIIVPKMSIELELIAQFEKVLFEIVNKFVTALTLDFF